VHHGLNKYNGEIFAFLLNDSELTPGMESRCMKQMYVAKDTLRATTKIIWKCLVGLTAITKEAWNTVHQIAEL
jgi:hypothetical protein